MPPSGALAARQHAAAAAGKRQQRHRSGEIETPVSRHASENAGILFNGTSTLPMEEFVKDKRSLRSRAA
jgi:hypothetical protein